MSIGIIARRDELQAPVNQAALLREALGPQRQTWGDASVETAV